MHDSIQEFIAHENIRRFEAQLEAAIDERQKSLIRGLLEVERQHLKMLQDGVEQSPS